MPAYRERAAQPCCNIMDYWFLKSARAYTRRIRAQINEHGRVGWSAPRDLKKGDLALVYEMGQPDDVTDLPGRKQIGWLLRATAEAEPDPDWRWGSYYEGFPLSRPLPLAEAKESERFARGPGRFMRGGHQSLDRATWTELASLIDRSNPG
jgi:hypothetical protein